MPAKYTPRIQYTCEYCAAVFVAPPSRAKHGRCRFCSRACKYAADAARHNDPADLFWAQVNRGDGCWDWQGGVGPKDGYGRVNVRLGPMRRKTLKAHRYAWELAHGPIPTGLEICHTCDNRRCVRIDHLFLGTHQDNTDDCIRKDRHARGERSGNAKLTDALVLSIRERWAAGESQSAIARDIGVASSCISSVVRRKRWTHI